ncbi:MAG: choice-of-anchor L domain-containing protein [Bacteroidia bacterium]
MKRYLHQLCFIFYIFFAAITAKAQLTFNSSMNANQMAQMLAGSGISISNATLNCPTGASGSFTGTSSLGIQNGIILTSGSITLASPNTGSSSSGTGNGTPGDSDLNGIAGAGTYDACGLEFDMIPLCDTIKFKYVFGSEEYPEYVNSGYNDAFAFFINGPGIPTPTNIAKLPGTSTIVTIDNVNSGANPQYYVANSGTTIEYDGHTTVLTAWSVVQPCQTYHMKIVIADAGDGIFDSGVFLEAGSLQCAATVAATATVQSAIEGCQDGSFEFCRSAPFTNPATINFTIAGSATNGTDYNTVATSVTIPAGQSCKTIPIVPVDDGIPEGIDSILIIYQPGPCPIMDTVVIYVADLAINAGPDKTICNDEDVVIGTTSLSGITYSWSPPTGLSSASVSNPTVTGFNSGTTSTTTNYVLTASLTGCSVTDTVAVTVNPSAVVDAGPDQTVCGGTVTLMGTITGASGGTWSGGTGTFAPNNTSLNCTYTPTNTEINAGLIKLYLTASGQLGNCPGAIDSIEINISITSAVSAGPDQTICFGNSATLIGSFGGNATSAQWSGGNGTFVPDNMSPTATYTPSSTEMTAGVVTLIYSAIDPGSTCEPVTDQVTITIDQQPTANAGSAQQVCKGDSILLAGTIGGSATSSTWSGGAGTFIPNNTTLNAIYVPTTAEYDAGSVSLTLTTNDPTGPCTFSSSNVTFTFYENPVVSFSATPTSGCPTLCTNFTDESTIAGTATIVGWDWDFDDNGEGSTLQNPSTCFVNSGYYDITLTATSSDGCTSSLTQTQLVEVFPIPNAEFSSSPNPASLIEPTISFNDESSSDVNYWMWDFGDGTTLGTTTSNPSHDYPDDTTNTYNVTLIVRNVNGCYDTVEHQVTIGPAFTFYIPNAFTPNNDGKNDYFNGSGIGIEEYTMRIFDRWGNMVFKTQDLNMHWDGKSNEGNSASQIDVFIWKVDIKDILNKKHTLMGTVTIVR